jgi:ribosomal protein S6--L-glutamate ligase
MADQLTIGVLAEQRYLAQSQPSGMLNALKRAGHRIVLIDPEAALFKLEDDKWLHGLDLIVGRGRSWGLLCLLGWAERRGIPTINRRAAIAAVHNKANMAVTLATNGVPTPKTFLGATRHLAEGLVESEFPVILKPIFGDNSRGLEVVRTPGELDAIEWPEPMALAQTYHQTDGYDLKLYGIGDKVWAIRKPSPFNRRNESEESRAGMVSLTPELEALGRKCGQIFGLELYGVDCIMNGSEPLVIEINDFPNYTSVPEADEQLADYVAQRAREENKP